MELCACAPCRCGSSERWRPSARICASGWTTWQPRGAAAAPGPSPTTQSIPCTRWGCRSSVQVVNSVFQMRKGVRAPLAIVMWLWESWQTLAKVLISFQPSQSRKASYHCRDLHSCGHYCGHQATHLSIVPKGWICWSFVQIQDSSDMLFRSFICTSRISFSYESFHHPVGTEFDDVENFSGRILSRCCHVLARCSSNSWRDRCRIGLDPALSRHWAVTLNRWMLDALDCRALLLA